MNQSKFLSVITAFWIFFTLIPLSYSADMPAVAGDEVQRAIANMAKQMEEMKKLIQEQNAKIEFLEQKTKDGVKISQPTPASSAQAAMTEKDFQDMLKNEVKNAGYFKNLKMGGDFRLRWEAFNQGENASTTEDRNRFRYRLRYGVENGIGDDMTVGFRLATAGLNNTTAAGGTVYAGDPTSTNQTIGSPGLFSFNTIAIDKAYAKYAPKYLKDYQIGSTILKKFEIGGGKFDNPFLKYSSPLMWDGDVMPEGLYESFDWNLYQNEGNEVNLFGNALQSPLIESGTGDRDASLYGFQGGLNLVGYIPLTERPVEFTSAVAGYLYRNFAEDNNFTFGNGSTSLIRGMTGCVGTAAAAGSGCQGLEAGDPRILDFYNEIKLAPMNVPLKLFSDVATNVNNGAVSSASARKNTAWGFGLGIGELKKPKDWQVTYGYYQIPPNAVVGAFTDSDFGQGHNNNLGSVVKAGYQLTQALQLNFAWFNVTPYDTNLSTLGDQPTNRFQTDLAWKF